MKKEILCELCQANIGHQYKLLDDIKVCADCYEMAIIDAEII